MLGGASDPEHQEFMLPFSWLCLALGSLTSIYAVQSSASIGHRNILEDILSLDARTEIIRRRKPKKRLKYSDLNTNRAYETLR